MFYLIIFSDSKWDRVQLECIKCLKAIMNNKVGLRNLFDHKEALTLLARFVASPKYFSELLTDIDISGPSPPRSPS